MLYEIRWHGRGGQGAVTAAVILAKAAIYEGKHAQAYPEFGAERRGAPVRAYTRISDKPIRTRSPILKPDIVVVLDRSLPPSLFLSGLKPQGTLIMNTPLSPGEAASKLGIEGLYRVYTVDATRIALEKLGAPIVNTAMVGALAAVTGLVGLESIEWAIVDTLPGKVAEKNIQAVREAFERVSSLVEGKEVTL
ncbi:MAG: 2-oxoacid:acceptor oxidoreductase family protein [Desulfurococcales archaeon]|nr:2-oxoacid:acceptor oxidoreductase family protein [Desulfurococcales archaeon]